MKYGMGDGLTVSIASSIPERLRSLDSAEWLDSMVVGLCRGRAAGQNNPPC